MTTTTIDSDAPVISSTHCEHRSAKGARCRLPALNADTPFCYRHARQPENRRATDDLSDTLTADLGDLTSPSAINDFLRRLLLLLAQDRISTRRAAVLAYITSQLLRSVSAINK